MHDLLQTSPASPPTTQRTQISETAYRLALENKIWDKPMGLMGSWGGVIESWLHDLLPADAAQRCSGGLGVIVTELPSCRQVGALAVCLCARGACLRLIVKSPAPAPVCFGALSYTACLS